MKLPNKCKGIILGSFSFGESNKIISILTNELGIIKVVANGIRKPTSKYSGAMELMNKVDIYVRKSKSSDLYTIREYELIKSFHSLRNTYEIICNLYYISEFIIKFFESEISSIKVYNNLFSLLLLLEKYPDSVNELRWAFVLKSLLLLGYLPNLKYCSDCGKKLDKNIYISSRDGWIFCSRCSEYNVDKKISYGAINFLELVLNYDYKNIVKLKVSKKVQEDLDAFFHSIIYGILGKEMKSEFMFDTL